MNDFNEAVLGKSNDELLKMLYEFDQWSPEMLNTVEKELSHRKILPVDLAIEKQKKIEAEEIELSKGKQASLIGQVAGWLTAFGFLGIIIGYNYAFSKVKGKYAASEYFKYNDSSRKHGKNLFYASLLLSGTVIVYKLIELKGINL